MVRGELYKTQVPASISAMLIEHLVHEILGISRTEYRAMPHAEQMLHYEYAQAISEVRLENQKQQEQEARRLSSRARRQH